VKTECKVDEYGFTGFLFEPEYDNYIGKAVIVITGSDGGVDNAKLIAEYICQHGQIHTLAVGYWNTPTTPDMLSNVPVETIENAVKFLKDHKFDKVGIYGGSKGGELSLLAGSLIPDITSVVAMSPLFCVFQGIERNGKPSKTSSWSWRGQPLPYCSSKMHLSLLLGPSIKHREWRMVELYKKAINERLTEDAIIKVENIHGPILLLSAEDDAMWPSAYSCEKVCERLASNNFAYNYKHQSYRYTSHVLMPPIENAKMNAVLRMWQIERKYPKECRKSKEDAFQLTLDFWRQW
jgi:dienelactone hydrolase